MMSDPHPQVVLDDVRAELSAAVARARALVAHNRLLFHAAPDRSPEATAMEASLIERTPEKGKGSPDT